MSDADPVMHRLPPGTVLGRLYRVIQPLGRGAQGDVYEVEHVRLGTRFAAKVLLPYLASDPASISRFEREASTASRLEHPNIARVVNFDQTEDGRYFAVLELLEGEDLAHALRRGPLPVRRACELALDVASALAAAHEAGVVHRDLKPSNLFLARTRTGQVVKLTDFGISKVISGADAPRLTSTGAVVGTPMYMAPEQASGEVVDLRIDVYALGVVLFEMMAGQPPFASRKSAQLIMEKAYRDPPDPEALLPGLPKPIAQVVRRALSKRPDERFADMKAFSDALRAAVQSAEVDPALVLSMKAPPSMPADLASLTLPPPSRTGLYVAGGLFGGAAVGVVAFLLATWLSQPAPVPAPPPAKVAQVEPPPPAPRAVVRLESDPPGARVLDAAGDALGETPLSLTLEKAAIYQVVGAAGVRAEVSLDPDVHAGQTVQVVLPKPAAPPPRRRVVRTKKAPEPIPVQID